ncbi:hypothetical protein HDU86_005813 [Geranomyces michiganensis]|nr:hypothetical protein HDU86_005813 [Geranomyces michiganensis]
MITELDPSSPGLGRTPLNAHGTAVPGSPTTPTQAANPLNYQQQPDEAEPYSLISDSSSASPAEEEFPTSLISIGRMNHHIDDERNVIELQLAFAEQVASCFTEQQAIALRDVLDAKLVKANSHPDYAQELIYEPTHQDWRRRYNLPTVDSIKKCKCGARSQQAAKATANGAADKEAALRAAAERDRVAKEMADTAAERDRAAKEAADREAALRAAAERDRAAKEAADREVALRAAVEKDAAVRAAAANDKATKVAVEGDLAAKAAANRNAAVHTAEPVATNGGMNTNAAAERHTPARSPTVIDAASSAGDKHKHPTASSAAPRVAAAPIVIDLTMDEDEADGSQGNMSISSAPTASRRSATNSGSASDSVQLIANESSSVEVTGTYIPPHLRMDAGNPVTVSQLSAPVYPTSANSSAPPASYLAPHMRDSTNTRSTLKSAPQSWKFSRYNPIERRSTRPPPPSLPNSDWLSTRMNTHATGPSGSASTVTVRAAGRRPVPVPIAPAPTSDPTGTFRYSSGYNQRKTGYVIKEILRFDDNGRPEYRQ